MPLLLVVPLAVTPVVPRPRRKKKKKKKPTWTLTSLTNRRRVRVRSRLHTIGTILDLAYARCKEGLLVLKTHELTYTYTHASHAFDLSSWYNFTRCLKCTQKICGEYKKRRYASAQSSTHLAALPTQVPTLYPRRALTMWPS